MEKQKIISLQCCYCDAKFDSTVQLIKHSVSVHEGKMIYFCPICDLTFSQRQSLNEHVLSKHQVKKGSIKCCFCDVIFAKLQDLKIHCKLVHEGKKCFYCSICESTFSSKLALDEHVELDHSTNNGNANQSFICYICEDLLVFQDEISLKSHVEQLHSLQHTSSLEEIKHQEIENLNISKLKDRQPEQQNSVKQLSNKIVNYCSNCQKSFQSFEDLNHHCENVHGITKENTNVRVINSKGHNSNDGHPRDKPQFQINKIDLTSKPSENIEKLIDPNGDIVYSLPHGWKKLCRRRKNSNGPRHWDIYAVTPTGKRLRSKKYLEQYLTENPDVQCDLSVTNNNRPSDLNDLSEEDKCNLKEPKVCVIGFLESCILKSNPSNRAQILTHSIPIASKKLSFH